VGIVICIEKNKGTGTFGRVRLAKSKKEEKYFALKQLKKSEVVRLKQVEHVGAERQLLANVDHPYIVRLYDPINGHHSYFL
jgi:serine/threonine protein kinase